MELGLGGQGIFTARHLLPRVAIVPVVHVGQRSAAGEGSFADGSQSGRQHIYSFQCSAAGKGVGANGKRTVLVDIHPDSAHLLSRRVPRCGGSIIVVRHPAGGAVFCVKDGKHSLFGIHIPRQIIAAGTKIVSCGGHADAVITAADLRTVQCTDSIVVCLSLLKGLIAVSGTADPISQYFPFTAVYSAVDAVALRIGSRLPCDHNAMPVGIRTGQNYVVRYGI